MTRTNTSRGGRRGFTLIELLVAISIILALAGFGLLMYPGARDNDRVRNAVSDVGSTCKLAQAMASRDKAPRGVRFIVDTTKPGDPRLVTELQYVELPPPLIPNPKPLTPTAQNPTANPDLEPRVRFTYKVAAVGSANPLPGTITNRQCFVENLTFDQASQVKSGCTIVMPVFGTWHRISSIAAPGFREVPAGSGRYSGEALLDVYPDAVMGAGTDAVVYHFAIYLLATPLVGEPTVLLTKGVCVDLNTQDLTNTDPNLHYRVGSVGPPPNTTTDFDVIFGPDGKLVGATSGQIFLLVRDATKVPSMRIRQGPDLVTAFRKGGDSYILSIRQSGTIGNNQVTWPDLTTGYYPAGSDPFSLARQDLNQ